MVYNMIFKQKVVLGGIFVIFAFALFFLFFPQLSSARQPCPSPCYSSDCCCCVSECGEGFCSGYVYRANTEGCNPTINRAFWYSVCDESGCECVHGGPTTCDKCGSWQTAFRSPCKVTSFGLIRPECKCKGDCIETPENARYYDNPEYPTDPCNPEPGVRPENIYLPVKLDWDDVKGWKEGWIKNKCKPCAETCSCPCCPYPEECYEKAECVKSYEIKIEGVLDRKSVV